MRNEVEDYNIFNKEVFKINLFKICILIIFIISIFVFKTILVSSNEGFIKRISTKVLGFSFPNLTTGDFSHKSSNIKLFPYDIFNFKKDIIKDEISFLKTINCNDNIYDSYDKSEKLKSHEKINFENTDEEIRGFILDDSSIKLNKNEGNINTLGKKPRVLIYHTHTGEAYYPIGDDPSRSRNNKYNVCAVGDKIKSILESEYNIEVIHDIKIHDENYTKSYQKSRETLKEYLSKYGDFDLIIDLHRDSIEDKKMAQCTIGDEKAAKFMFVMCTANPNYNEQKKIVDKLLTITKEKYPQLLRSNEILTYKNGIGYYSQDLSAKSLLIECGTNLNTIEEALVTAKYISEILGKYLVN